MKKVKVSSIYFKKIQQSGKVSTRIVHRWNNQTGNVKDIGNHNIAHIGQNVKVINSDP